MNLATMFIMLLVTLLVISNITNETRRHHR